MKHIFYFVIVFLLMGMSCTTKKKKAEENCEIKLITLDPGHFHAALVQKTSYPQVCKDVYVYAPKGADLQEHLMRIESYNARTESPTQWNQIVYERPDFFEKMLEEKKGNVMVTAGNNNNKTAYIKKTLEAGINVLADKPMAINVKDFVMLQECFDIAHQKDMLLYDIMTERFEITTLLQKEFSLISSVYGEQQMGSANNPSIVKESVHHFYKTVSGSPLIRPSWFFDVEQQGAGIVDVTTHLVDLVQWECFPNQVIDHTKDIELLDANYWDTPMTLPEFQVVTGSQSFPDYLKKDIKGEILHVYSNGDITYKIKGVHAKVSVIWNYVAPEGTGDTHYSIMKGSKADLIIKQGKEQAYKPILYIQAIQNADLDAFEAQLVKALEAITAKYPQVSLSKEPKEGMWKVIIPETYHVGHEAHFGQVTENYLQYLTHGTLPKWEVPNMITKYYITTHALEMAKNKMKKIN